MNDWTTLDLELVTPLLSKGTGRQAEFRIPSLLGSLRHTTVDEATTHRLFGSVNSPNPFQWRLVTPPQPIVSSDPVKAFGPRGATIASLITGPTHQGSYRIPPFIPASTHVQLMVRQRTTSGDTGLFQQLMGYLDAASILTGMGGKTSRGFGGFQIVKVTGPHPTSQPILKTPLSGYRELIKQLDDGHAARTPLDSVGATVKWAWLSRETFESWQTALAVGAVALNHTKTAIGIVRGQPDARRLALFGKPVQWKGRRVSGGRLPSPFRIRILAADDSGYRLAAYYTCHASQASNSAFLTSAQRAWGAGFASALEPSWVKGEISATDTSPSPRSATATG